MNKSDILIEVATKTGATQKETREIIDSFIEEVIQRLETGEKVTIKNLGTFQVVERADREGVNPRTGERMQISGKKGVRFLPSNNLKERVR